MVENREWVGAHSAEILGSDGKPVLRRSPEWKGVVVERKGIPLRAECGPQFSGMPVVIASKFSPGRRWYRCNGTTQEIPMEAPGLDMMSATYERDYGRWECEPGGETICVRLPPDVMQHYVQEDAYHFDLQTGYCKKDDRLVEAIFGLADEIQNGFPNGMLYAEGMSLMIVGWLSRHHSAKPMSGASQARGLSAVQQARVREFVVTHLDSDISVEAMADEAGLSPFHFSRLFRATFGMPPYRYVLQARIARAAHLLRADKRRTVADIALEVGFASQAHMTHAFKSCMGQTPARWRAS